MFVYSSNLLEQHEIISKTTVTVSAATKRTRFTVLHCSLLSKQAGWALYVPTDAIVSPLDAWAVLCYQGSLKTSLFLVNTHPFKRQIRYVVYWSHAWSHAIFFSFALCYGLQESKDKIEINVHGSSYSWLPMIMFLPLGKMYNNYDFILCDII